MGISPSFPVLSFSVLSFFLTLGWSQGGGADASSALHGRNACSPEENP